MNMHMRYAHTQTNLQCAYVLYLYLFRCLQTSINNISLILSETGCSYGDFQFFSVRCKQQGIRGVLNFCTCYNKDKRRTAQYTSNCKCFFRMLIYCSIRIYGSVYGQTYRQHQCKNILLLFCTGVLHHFCTDIDVKL